MEPSVKIIGAGLAGCEAALYLADHGVKSILYDIKPNSFSPAHKSPNFAELVCSNSLRSQETTSAVGLLKKEMQMLGSRFMECAFETMVPAGKALAVDREKFSLCLTNMVKENPNIKFCTKEWMELPEKGIVILATGPLTTPALLENLSSLTTSAGLHFYDAISPMVETDTVDPEKSYWKDRWDDKSEGDYLNCPLTKEEYDIFYDELIKAKQVPLHDFEEPRFFEGCLPIEVMAARGYKTLLFGPMKPVGLWQPGADSKPHAVVQLRKENAAGTSLNMVGFQTKLTYPEQKRIFSLIPALKNANFLRFGSIHRNTFVDAPRNLDCFIRLKNRSNIFLAGQISGIEGYVESAATGLLVAFNVLRLMEKKKLVIPPPTTALGSLVTHLTNLETKDFQPSNVNFGLFPQLTEHHNKKERKQKYAERALGDMKNWLEILKL